MNKFILIALVATAAAGQDSCATAEELRKSNMEDYKLKYKFTSDATPTDLTKATSISYDKNDVSNIVADVKLDTTFKIEGWSAKKETPAGFRIYSQDKSKVLSWNQASMGGNGYYMYAVTDKRFLPGGTYPWYTLFNYTDKDKGLEYMDNASNKFKAGLQVYKDQYTLFYQSGTGPTQFCFVKVSTPYVKLDSVTSKCEAGGYDSITKREECKSSATSLKLTFKDSTEINFQQIVPPGCYSEEKGVNAGVWFNPKLDSTANGILYKDYPICSRPPTCNVDNFVTDMEKKKAEVKDPKCKGHSSVKENIECEVSCKDPNVGDNVKYTCKDGKFTAQKEIDCKVPKTSCTVDSAVLTKLINLNAEFKAATKCEKGKTFGEGSTCLATCAKGKTGTPAKYTCKNGQWNDPKPAIVCKVSPKTCKVADFVTQHKNLKAEVKDTNCQGITVQENQECGVSCEDGYKGDSVKYTCKDDGTFKAEAEDIACIPNTSCTVDNDLLTKLINLKAEFKAAAKCKKGQTIGDGSTCLATCATGKTGTPATYTCKNGNWKDPKPDIVCKDSTTTCNVDDFVTQHKNLKAEVKDTTCPANSTVKENHDCDVSCKDGYKGDSVKYTCEDDGTFKAVTEIACTSSFVQIGAFTAFICLFVLN